MAVALGDRARRGVAGQRHTPLPLCRIAVATRPVIRSQPAGVSAAKPPSIDRALPPSPAKRTYETDQRLPVLVLFRHDLRVADNRALSAAAATGKPVLPVFLLDEQAGRAPGAARRWWLHHSLVALGESLAALGTPLVLRRGPTSRIVTELVEATGADLVMWNRRYEPSAVETDRALKSWLTTIGIAAESFDGQLLHEPWTVKTAAGEPYKVFSAFWRAANAGPEPRAAVDAPKSLCCMPDAPPSERLDDWRLLPQRPDWAGGLRAAWEPGEEGAQKRLAEFIGGLAGYAAGRDLPARDATSRLSPHLAHGEITPFQIVQTLREMDAPAVDKSKFLAELGWREFSWHLLFHFPDLASQNFQPAFDAMGWRDAPGALVAWQQGRTGYPLVDAGMRQLWTTGWMHNRVRMVAASFLTKHLLIDWRAGERWFWDTLVDADAANNPASWQWVAGSGADAAPYFRIFNPLLQGERFDPDARYVREHVAELAAIPPAEILRAGGDVKLAAGYPVALIDHPFARQRALAAYHSMRGNP
ncbi:MAG: deoxyribodipyrimidine photo-lyase [Rhizobiaceae bacterium]|nr:deoxyribodipyrimidine photo-lyase [Rhizobiaceae bacterium]